MNEEATASRSRPLSADQLLSSIFAAPTVRLNGRSGLEVHSLISHTHIPLYLFAIKSLGHFWPDICAVVHDDGSLTSPDMKMLHQHIDGLRIVTRHEADTLVEDALADYPLLLEVRRNNVRILQLTDYFVLATSAKVIGMDSDIVFTDTPTELMRWGSDLDDRTAFLYSFEQFGHGRGPMGVHWIPKALPSVPYVPEMCCGFVCADRSEFFDPAYLETMMERTPRNILFRRRYVTQMFYSVLGGRIQDRTRSLGEPYRSGPWEWLPPVERRVLCHYFGSLKGTNREARTLTLLDRYASLFTSVVNRLESD